LERGDKRRGAVDSVLYYRLVWAKDCEGQNGMKWCRGRRCRGAPKIYGCCSYKPCAVVCGSWGCLRWSCLGGGGTLLRGLGERGGTKTLRNLVSCWVSWIL